ncbi:MAG: hypothetical protein ACO1PM_08770 [Acidovorax sp.]
MNAVATPLKAARASRGKPAAPAQPPVPAWATLLDAITQDLGRVYSTVAEVAEKLLGNEGEIVVLLDMALAHISATLDMLTKNQPTQALTDDAFYTLGKPLALLLGAAAMTRELKVDIFSDTIVRAHAMLDECQDNLDSQAIGKLLPEGQTITISAPPAADPHDVAEHGSAVDRRELARQANLEIMKLAEAMQLINEAHGEEEHPITHGIMARIIVLSEIVFSGAELHGDDPAEFGTDSIEVLRRAFKGVL